MFVLLGTAPTLFTEELLTVAVDQSIEVVVTDYAVDVVSFLFLVFNGDELLWPDVGGTDDDYSSVLGDARHLDGSHDGQGFLNVFPTVSEHSGNSDLMPTQRVVLSDIKTCEVDSAGAFILESVALIINVDDLFRAAAVS